MLASQVDRIDNHENKKRKKAGFIIEHAHTHISDEQKKKEM